MPSKKKGRKDPNQNPELSATSGSQLIADSGGGKSPPPPPESNAARVSLPSVDSGATRVDAEVSSGLPATSSFSERLTFGQVKSVGSIEPSTFLRPSLGGNFTFPHVVSPLAGISGSVLDTDFTPLTPSIDRRATVEEVEYEDDRSEGRRRGCGSQYEPLIAKSRASSKPSIEVVPMEGYESLLEGHRSHRMYDLDSLLGRSTLQPTTTSVEERPASERERHVNGKKKASQYSSNDEEERLLREAMQRSLRDAGVGDENTIPTDWDAKVRQQAQDALERDRAMRGQGAMARHLREMAGQAEKNLRDKRIDEDGEYAVEMLARDIEESEDRLFAEALVAIESKHREATAEADRYAVEAVANLRKKEISAAMKNLSPDKSDGYGAGERTTHNFHDRVKLQRYRLQDIVSQGYSNIPDQGIEWRDKVPYEVSSARTRGSSLASQQRYAEKRSETAKPIKRGISEAQKSAEKRPTYNGRRSGEAKGTLYESRCSKDCRKIWGGQSR
ncbi:hypothetical protein C8J57DRAFT_1223155 [Mycena rebaudengoi]|nr:hypothetical protein C8J57DRAFT_1223155 [Mycena rebaudengoi]